MIPGCWPGGTFGAAGAVTPGVNRLPPVGLTPFLVGDGGAALNDGVVVVVVVVEVVEGVCCPPLPQAAKVPISISTEAQAMAIRRRLVRPVFTIHVPFVIEVLIATVDAGRFGGRGRRQNLRREQVAAGWIDALLRRRRRRCAGWWRRSGRRGGCCRGGRLLAVIAAASCECAHCDQGSTASYNHQATSERVRAHENQD